MSNIKTKKITHLQNVIRDVVSLGSGSHDWYERSDANLHIPVSSTKRLDFISLEDRSGCSTIAAQVARLLAMRRGSRVLGVDASMVGIPKTPDRFNHFDASGTSRSFVELTRAIQTPTPNVDSDPKKPSRVLHYVPPANSVVKATEHLLTGDSGLRVLPLTESAENIADKQWRAQVEPVARFFDLIVTDWGWRVPDIDLEQVIIGSHAVTIVCRSKRADIETAASVAGAISKKVPCGVCVVDIDNTGPLPSKAAKTWGYPLIELSPHNPHDQSRQYSPLANRDATLRLASWLMQAAAGSSFATKIYSVRGKR